MKKLFTSVFVFLMIASVVFAQGGSETKAYPSKDIQFYVSSGAGGGTDSICRKICQLAEPALKGSFYLVNKPGVNDSVAPNLVMNASADGYTIGNISYGGVVTAVYQNNITGYSLDKIRPIVLVTEEYDAVMVSKNSPFKTFDEFIKAAKANPGQIKVADQGVGSRVYLLVRKIEKAFGVEFNKISYSGSAPQREAMLNGEVDAAVTSLGDFAPLLKSGDAIGIVEFSNIQNATYTTVPTASSLGLDDSFLSSSFLGIIAPAGITDEQAATLEAVFKAAIESKEFKDWTATVGITAHYLGSKDFQAFMKAKQERDFVALDGLKKEGINF